MKKGDIGSGLTYHAGFPNAGEDQREGGLSLDKLVVKHRASTYFWRLEHAVDELNWRQGSIVVVDRAVPLAQGRTVVAYTDAGFAVCIYKKDGLRTLTGDFVEETAQIWGVITYVVHEV